MNRRLKSRRPLRREILPLAVAVAVPLVLTAVFPHETFAFRAADGATPACSCAFVTLSPEAERKALAAARAAWQTGSEGARGLRAEMFAVPLAEFAPDEVVVRSARPVGGVRDLRFAAPPSPPSLAASFPDPLELPSPEAPQPAFSRDDLLQGEKPTDILKRYSPPAP